MLVVFLLLLLWAIPLPSTRIGLVARVSAVEFRLARSSRTHTLLVRDIEIDGPTRIARKGETVPARGGLTIVADAADRASRPITLSEIRLPAKQWVQVVSEGGGRFSLSFVNSDSLVLQVLVPPGATVSDRPWLDEETALQLEAAAPPYRFRNAGQSVVPLSIHQQSGDLRLVFSLTKDEERIAPLMAIDRLELDEYDGEQTFSTIRSARLILEDRGGAALELHEGDALVLSELEGELRSLTMERDALAIRAAGRVGGLAAGSVQTPRSKMPSILEWLAQRPFLKLVAAGLSLGATLFAAAPELRKRL